MDHVIAVVWPRPENYARFLDICGPGEFPPTYIEFVQQALQMLALRGIDPSSIEKVDVDPDEMQEWCLRHHGKIDTEARALFALHKVRLRHGDGPQTIN